MMTTQVGFPFLSFFPPFALLLGLGKMAGKLFESPGMAGERERERNLGLTGTDNIVDDSQGLLIVGRLYILSLRSQYNAD